MTNDEILRALYSILHDPRASSTDKAAAASILRASGNLNEVVTAPNWTIPNIDNATATTTTTTADNIIDVSSTPVAGAAATAGRWSLRGALSNLRNPNRPLINADLGSLKGLASDIRAKPLWQGGPSVATSANVLSGLYQGGTALKGLYDNSMKQSDYDSLKNDIVASVASNPMYDTYMDASDEKLLRKMQNGTLTDNWSGATEGVMKGIPKALLSTIIGGVTGGVPGAAIGGIGSLVNSGIQGYGKGTDTSISQLQGLYGRLRQANEDYRSMKRPAGLRRAGLSTQYFNQLY